MAEDYDVVWSGASWRETPPAVASPSPPTVAPRAMRRQLGVVKTLKAWRRIRGYRHPRDLIATSGVRSVLAIERGEPVNQLSFHQLAHVLGIPVTWIAEYHHRGA